MRLLKLALPLALLALAALAPAQGKKARPQARAPKQNVANPDKMTKNYLAKRAEYPSQAEIAKVAAFLSEKPVAFGRPIADRAAWDTLAATPSGKGVIRAAEQVLKTPMPEKPESVYLIYTKTGSRSESDRLDGRRRGRIGSLAEAECLENKGRFIPEIERSIRALCAEPTWVGTAHDGSLGNYHKKQVTIDLMSSALAWNLATTDWMLGDKLSPEIRQLIRKEVQWRIFDPFHRMIEGKQSLYWMAAEHNWNTVCLAGSVGAALALIDSREERALFVLSGMHYSENFLKGFTPDGYCGEGTGYWNYGFGHYILLSEIIRLATSDKIDLLARKEALAPATFGARWEVAQGVCPPFADTSPGDRPSAYLIKFINERYGLAPKADPKRDRNFGGRLIFDDMLYLFPVPFQGAASAEAAPATSPLRSWFDSAGILLSRPAPGSACRLATAIIGNNNGVNHNHNDVGSFIVLVGDRMVISDPGGEQYTKRTFSAQRYVSGVLNSFGHCCPLVAGKMQEAGYAARAVTLKAEFSDACDTLAFDIKSAYKVPELKTLTRQYDFSRQGAGSMTVTDTVAFTSPQTYETALITNGEWKQTGPNTLQVSDGGQTLNVVIDAGGQAIELKSEQIHEHVHTKTLPTRIGIAIKAPVAQAALRVTMTPAAK